MGEAPPRMEIDRIDNDGDYCKENCRWATRTEQTRNASNAVKITAHGETMCVTEWAQRLGITQSALSKRASRLGSHVDAILVGGKYSRGTP